MSPSIWQILIVLVIIMLLFGANRIPGLGKSLGEAIRGFKKGLSEDPAVDVTDSAKPEGLKRGAAESTAKTQKEKEESQV